MLRQWLVEADREDDSQYDWDAIETELQNSALSCGNSDPAFAEMFGMPEWLEIRRGPAGLD